MTQLASHVDESFESLRVLNVSPKRHLSFEEALASQELTRIDLVSASAATALKLLREEMFDVVILHDTHEQDSTTLIGPLRTAAPDGLAIVVICNRNGDACPRQSLARDQTPEQRHSGDRFSVCVAAGADDFVDADLGSIQTLMWKLQRAAERQVLLRDCRAARQQKTKRDSEDHSEAVRQLRTQRSLLLEHIEGGNAAGEVADTENSNPNPPEWLIEYFGDLLRVYVVSGFGNHQDEVRQLLDRLEYCEVTLAEALMAHSIAVEQLVLGRRGRSAWHILGRANLIAIELLMQREARQVQDSSVVVDRSVDPTLPTS